MNIALWIAQAVLALIFLAAGGTKLVLPMRELADQSGLPGPFMRFIGLAEVMGAFGLILPDLLRIRAGLTTLAALGLLVIMAGAVGLTVADGAIAAAVLPLTVGSVLVFVLYARRPLPEERVATAPTVANWQPAAVHPQVLLALHRASWEQRFDRLDAYLRTLQGARMNGAT